MKTSCKNKSDESTTNSNLQSQSQPCSNPPGTQLGSLSTSAGSFPRAPGAYPGSSLGSSHKSPIFLTNHDSSSSSDSEPKLTGADRIIRLLRKAKKPKKKPNYNFYEEVVLRQEANLRKQREDIMKPLQPSRPDPTNNEDEKNT